MQAQRPLPSVTPEAPGARALVLAAGRGQRMRPLTDTTPKPLLIVRGKALLQWWIEAMRRDGVREAVINTGWLGAQIEQQFAPQTQSGGSARQQPHIRFSSEARDFGHALETAGGIARALPLLAPAPRDVFWVVAGDIFAPDFRFDPEAARRFQASGLLAQLWLTPNPAHNPAGDFVLGADGLARNQPARPDEPRLTFSTFALYRRALFEPPWCAIAPGNPRGQCLPLAPLLRAAIDAGQVGATLYTGQWVDVGTPERLAQLNAD
ncbi:MAG: nucleotidyltransferase family protein [Burkholderiaceae bacterium]|jgi:MurNAc alpha-1-phosphate uridylyltransferase|nr:nucleotidyltransferase family protein [Burkholderiaceae bacterium]